MTMHVETSVEALAGKHEGESCWIVGSGPSLDDVKLGEIPKDAHIYCLNAAMTLFADSKKWKNAWWIYRDRRICMEVGKRLSGWLKWKVLTHKKALQNLKDSRIARYKNVVAYLYEPTALVHKRTVVEDALQIVQMLGYEEVNLLGIDHCIVDGRPYARNLMWKHCYFHDTNKPQEEGRKPIEAMVRAMEDLKPKIDKIKVYNLSPYYPRPVFEQRTFAQAVGG